MIKGYFDDSTASKEGFLVLAGYLAKIDGWLAYNKECERLLKNLNIKEFKMAKLANSTEGMEQAKWLYRQAIEQNVLCRVAVISSIHDVQSAVGSFHWPSNIYNRELFNDPYFLTWKGIVSTINQERLSAKIADPIELTFDKQNH